MGEGKGKNREWPNVYENVPYVRRVQYGYYLNMFGSNSRTSQKLESTDDRKEQKWETDVHCEDFRRTRKFVVTSNMLEGADNRTYLTTPGCRKKVQLKPGLYQLKYPDIGNTPNVVDIIDERSEKIWTLRFENDEAHNVFINTIEDFLNGEYQVGSQYVKEAFPTRKKSDAIAAAPTPQEPVEDPPKIQKNSGGKGFSEFKDGGSRRSSAFTTT